MNNKLKNLVFIFLIVLYLELMFHLFIFKLSLNLLMVVLFSINWSLIIYFITSIFKKKINNIIFLIISFMLSFVFTIQVIYYNTYETIISFYSFKQTNKVMEFADAMFEMMINNWIYILLLFIPFLLSIIYIKFNNFKKNDILQKLIILLLIGISYFLNIFLLQVNKTNLYSSYNLYYKIHFPIISVDNLGLLTTMRLDFKRSIFGFKNKIIKTKKENIIENKTYEPNVLNIDFDSLIKNETDETIKSIHEYFNNETPTYKNEYTGLFENKNLILFLAEALDPIAIDKEITPTLYKLVHEGFNFTNFYTPIYPVSTSDGEYIQQLSLIPKEGIWSLKNSYQNYLPFTMANMLSKLNYKTYAYHGHYGTYYSRHLSMPNLGYQSYKACGMGLKINCSRWPESDIEVIQASINDYIKNDNFMVFYVSISGHLNYTRLGNTIVNKNWNLVKHLNYSDKVKGYMAAQLELDRSIALLIEELEKNNKLDNTVIAISPDHYPYGLKLEEINEKSDYVRDDVFEKHHSTFILWNNNMQKETITTLCSNLDVLPTLANLFGLNYDSRLYMGKDIFSEHDPLIIFSNRSFITNKGKYNSLTKTFDGTKMNDSYISNIKNIIYNKYSISSLILEKNYYKYIK